MTARTIELASFDDYIRHAARTTDSEVRDPNRTIESGVENLYAAGFEVEDVSVDDWHVRIENYLIGSSVAVRYRHVTVLASKGGRDCEVTIAQQQAKPGRVWCDRSVWVVRREWVA
jgi:hypothetical protein